MLKLIKDAFAKYINTITWGNWKYEKEDVTKHDGRTYYLGGEVFNNQLEWVKEELSIQEDSEFGFLIEDWQKTLCPLLNIIETAPYPNKGEVRDIYDELSRVLINYKEKSKQDIAFFDGFFTMVRNLSYL